MGWGADARTTMVSVLHICSDCKYLCSYTITVTTMTSQNCQARNPCCAGHVLFFCLIEMMVWFCSSLQSLTLSVYSERNVQVSVHTSWREEMATHQYTSFLETCLVPLLHRSAWPVGSLLSPFRGAQKLNDDIAFQGWALPVQDTSLIWHWG